MAPSLLSGELSLARLEKTVAKGMASFIDAGIALEQIFTRRLYKPQYTTWNLYLRYRWAISRQHADRLIKAARIFYREMSPAGDISLKVVCEGQLRPLLRLSDAPRRLEAFRNAVTVANDSPPTSTQVAEAVDRIKLRDTLGQCSTTDASNESRLPCSKFKIILGDSTNALLLKTNTVDLVVGSPPYNLGMSYPTTSDSLTPKEYARRRSKWLKNCLKWTRAGGRLALIVPVDVRKPEPYPLGTFFTQNAIDAGWTYVSTIIWAEGSHRQWNLPADPPTSPQAITCPDELILIFSKGSMKRVNPGQMPDVSPADFRQWMLGHWQIPGAHASAVGHPCPFPAELPRRLIQMLTYPGEVVLDPWMGSGTTVLEALRLGRKAIGIEIEPSFCELANKRISKLRIPGSPTR